MSRHRQPMRPRYGRIAALAASVTVSAVAALAAFGVLTTGTAQAGSSGGPAQLSGGLDSSATAPPSGDPSASSSADTSASPGDTSPTGAQHTSVTGTPPSVRGEAPPGEPGSTSSGSRGSAKALPADSGTGRRIVFSQSLQRVWLVGAKDDDVQRTYLVSGSLTHNLQPGTYSVYSRSRWAVGVDDSGVMQYFVRFTQGPTGAAIGFHSIPTKDGVPLQTRAQLGTPRSHGCIRQYLPDAVALWDFAPVGTKVVVVA
jgi:L,D-transpeptidase catalytic domain